MQLKLFIRVGKHKSCQGTMIFNILNFNTSVFVKTSQPRACYSLTRLFVEMLHINIVKNYKPIIIPIMRKSMFMSRLKIRTKYNLRLQKIITVSHIRLHIVPITIPHCT